ncbi:hypothetical protein NC653_036349 [Populus alba x Populus x berolinensis]|uniref:Uncharacterized protein n=1 Tax=Populus alba x Populus x berolinensis TaxID=444605 RepID=A0AAD6PUT7_9ROSI|nr:hypothetical protein NC653_036349 [Populus alba x Populus x berolinensis]
MPTLFNANGSEKGEKRLTWLGSGWRRSGGRRLVTARERHPCSLFTVEPSLLQCWTCCRHGTEKDKLLFSCSLFLFSCELLLWLLHMKENVAPLKEKKNGDGNEGTKAMAHGKKRGVRAGAYGGDGGYGLGKMVGKVLVEKRERGNDDCERESAGSQGLLGKATAKDER